MKVITTSWDDGHPLDFRLAELLDKYNLKGTFYIPRNNSENEVMRENDIQSLSRHFEIGGHTLNHISLKSCSKKTMNEEVKGCFDWLNEITGSDPVSFCLPFGHYTKESLSTIYQSGFKVARTTELLSTTARLPLLSTTMQVYNHTRFTYLKHLTKRKKIKRLMLWSKSGCASENLQLIDHYLNHIDHKGGCFHLWGHSWEIDQYNLWNQLESIFQRLSNLSGFRYTDNKGLYHMQPVTQ